MVVAYSPRKIPPSPINKSLLASSFNKQSHLVVSQDTKPLGLASQDTKPLGAWPPKIQHLGNSSSKISFSFLFGYTVPSLLIQQTKPPGGLPRYKATGAGLPRYKATGGVASQEQHLGDSSSKISFSFLFCYAVPSLLIQHREPPGGLPRYKATGAGLPRNKATGGVAS